MTCDGITFTEHKHLAREYWPEISFWQQQEHPPEVVGELSVISLVEFGINSKFFSSEKNLIHLDTLIFKEHNSRLQRSTRLVLVASEIREPSDQ